MVSNQNRIIIICIILCNDSQYRMASMTQDSKQLSLSPIATNLRVAETRGNDHAQSKQYKEASVLSVCMRHIII